MKNFYYKSFLNSLFHELKIQGLEFVLLRHYKNLYNFKKNRDVDIFVSKIFFKNSYQIIKKLAYLLDFKIYHFEKNERYHQFYIAKKINNFDFLSVKLDFFNDIQVYGIQLFDEETILMTKKKKLNYFICSEDFYFLDKWLFCYLTRSTLPEKYNFDYSRIYNRNLTLKLKLNNIFPYKINNISYNSKNIYNFSKKNQISLLSLTNVLLFNFCKRPIHNFSKILILLRSKIIKTIYRKGIFVTFSGPDGSGKTTLINSLKPKLSYLFGDDSFNIFHFRPQLLPALSKIALIFSRKNKIDDNYCDPYRARSSGTFISLLRFYYYYLDYLFGYLFIVRPLLQNNKIVIFDRYFYDFLADPRRLRINLPTKFMYFFINFLPKPDLSFFISVKNEIVFQRKKELNLSEIKQVNIKLSSMCKENLLIRINNNSNKKQKIISHIINKILLVNG